MTTLPDTRETLIRRLPDAADIEAWDHFVAVYEPLLYRLARSRALQPADAEDFVQEVMTAVARAVGRWVETPDRGPFRAWLLRIAHNLAVNFLTRPKHQRLAAGGSRIARLLGQIPAESQKDSCAELVEREYQRELFRWAAEQVQRRVDPRQWKAFWWTTVEQRAIDVVARQLDMPVSSVYIARSRITKRMRELVRDYEERKA